MTTSKINKCFKYLKNHEKTEKIPQRKLKIRKIEI